MFILTGFRVEDIKLIVNSHVHFDHAGGIAELQKLSGARVAASPWTADVMTKGIVPRDDPQFGLIIPIARVAQVTTVKDAEVLHAGSINYGAFHARSYESRYELDLAFLRKPSMLELGLCR